MFNLRLITTVKKIKVIAFKPKCVKKEDVLIKQTQFGYYYIVNYSKKPTTNNFDGISR